MLKMKDTITYQGETAVIIQPPHGRSPRITILTSDGRAISLSVADLEKQKAADSEEPTATL